MRRALPLALALALALTGAAPSAFAAEPDPEDPPICRDAIAAHPQRSALEALAEEEKRLAAEARRVQREADKLMRKTLGSGAGARAQLPAYEVLAAQESEARRVGKSLCYCRERRGDPHREDCELLYPMVIR